METSLQTPYSLAKMNRIIDLSNSYYDWSLQIRRYHNSGDTSRLESTMLGTDSGTKTHSGNEIFSDDEDRD